MESDSSTLKRLKFRMLRKFSVEKKSKRKENVESFSARHSMDDTLIAPTTPLTPTPEPESPPLTPTADAQLSLDVALDKRRCVVDELISTEEAYVRDLAVAIASYKAEMEQCPDEVPEDLRDGRARIIFGNIEAIYEWHRDHFLPNMREQRDAPAELAALVRKAERRLNMYVVYCKNKPSSEYLVASHLDYFDRLRQKAGHNLGLSDMLIKPVQRIMKYELLFKSLQKYSRKAGFEGEADALQEAIDILVKQVTLTNEMMEVGRLQDFKGNLTAQGRLIHFGTLQCIESKLDDRRDSNVSGQKLREMKVFLFEQSMIFADIVNKRASTLSSRAYNYFTHVPTNKLALEDCSSYNDEEYRFFVVHKDRDATNPGRAVLCSSGRALEDHMRWMDSIRTLLRAQEDFLNALASPIEHQKGAYFK